MDRIPMTTNGYKKLVEELDARKSVQRPRIIKAIAEARAHGDLSENAEYKAAKEEQGFNEGRIIELEGKIGRAEIHDTSKMSGEIVKFGATVTLEESENRGEERYQIVGEDEAEIVGQIDASDSGQKISKEGKISFSSPVARALIGKTVGDEIRVQLPHAKRKEYEILEVEYI